MLPEANQKVYYVEEYNSQIALIPVDEELLLRNPQFHSKLFIKNAGGRLQHLSHSDLLLLAQHQLGSHVHRQVAETKEILKKSEGQALVKNFLSHVKHLLEYFSVVANHVFKKLDFLLVGFGQLFLAQVSNDYVSRVVLVQEYRSKVGLVLETTTEFDRSFFYAHQVVLKFYFLYFVLDLLDWVRVS